MLKYRLASGWHFSPREVDEMKPSEIRAFQILAELEEEKDNLSKMGEKHHQLALDRTLRNQIEFRRDQKMAEQM